jgi:hypothetical protein
MNGKRKVRVTAGRGRELPHPDRRQWMRRITDDHELHLRMAGQHGRLEWLIAFGDRRGTLPENRPAAELAREIGLFMFLTDSGDAQAAFYAIVNPPNPELARRTIKDLSTQIGNGIADFVDGKSWRIVVDRPLTRTLTRLGIGGAKISAHNLWYTPNPHDARTDLYARNVEVWSLAFLLAAADTVAAEAAGLRRCAGCASIFAGADPRQTFHNRQCATARRVAAWRADEKKKTQKRRRGKRPSRRTK